MHSLSKKILASLLTIGTLTLCGCNAKEEVETEFQNQIDSFSKKVDALDAEINAIDTSVENYRELFLEKLDELDALFSKLPTYQEPTEYSEYYDIFAGNAAEFMSEAKMYFNHTYGDNSYNQTYIDIANEYYNAAIREIRNIGYMLAGYDVSGEIHDNDYLEEYEDKFWESLNNSNNEESTEQ